MWNFFEKKFSERNICTSNCSAIVKTVETIELYFNLMTDTLVPSAQL